MTAKRTAGTLLVMVLPLLTYTSASAHDSPDAEESEPAESSVEPTPDDEVVVTLPRGVADPTNTQVGPDITASELAREGHFHTAEVDVGAEPEGVEVSVEEQLADTVLDARPDDYWVDGGPASPQVDSVATGTASLATAASYMNIYMQAHPDDEASMFASIDSYGNNSGYHKVFAILTRGEQSNYCDFNGSSVQPNELDPNPIPEGKWRSSCDTARINSYMNFFRDAGSRYTYIDRSYSYYGEVSLSSTNPVNPCVRDDTADGFENAPDSDIGVDEALDVKHSDYRYTCTDKTQADDVRIYKGSSGYTTVLFFNLGDGDLTVKEVEWAMRRISDSASTLQLPSLTRWLVTAAFANINYSGCTHYNQPDHRVAQVGVYNFNISSYEQRGSTCDTDPDSDRILSVPIANWNAIFNSNSSTTAYSYHDRHYGWLFATLWSHPYALGKCGVDNNHISGEENCLFSRIQNYWSQF